jgi:hypothetical protein
MPETGGDAKGCEIEDNRFAIFVASWFNWF